MTKTSGALHLVARRSGVRTVLERIRYDGISRCSRAFVHDSAALVVLSQLGPGVVRGDRTTLDGVLRPDSHLIVTSQAALRLMGGGPATARANAHWQLEAGAALEIIAEPLVAAADASYESTATFELAAGARVLISEVACVPAGADVRLRTVVGQAGREIVYDAVDAAAAAPQTVGTLVVAGLTAPERAALVDTFDGVADAHPDLTTGVGALPEGVFVRVLGGDVWAVRSLLLALRAATRPAQAVAVPRTPTTAHDTGGIAAAELVSSLESPGQVV